MANASKTENERLERHLNGFLNYVTISSFQSNSEVKFIQFIEFHKNDGFSFPHTAITVLHSKHKESLTVQAENSHLGPIASNTALQILLLVKEKGSKKVK